MHAFADDFPGLHTGNAYRAWLCMHFRPFPVVSALGLFNSRMEHVLLLGLAIVGRNIMVNSVLHSG